MFRQLLRLSLIGFSRLGGLAQEFLRTSGWCPATPMEVEYNQIRSTIRFEVNSSTLGQGAWFLLTHHPDKIVAAAPVSGYSSIDSMKCRWEPPYVL